jgi:phospholipid/cholesterol/gamma-HCH transport system permease protein
MNDASAVRVPPRGRLAVIGGVLAIPVRGFFGYFGDHSMMLWKAALWLFRRPFRLRLFLDQMEFIGVQSLPIILLVGFFSGAVSAQQAVRALKLFGQERFVGATVGLSLALELAPVFTALMIAARAGSGMATELGSMRITEQIDALSTFAVNPIQYLITPRIAAAVIMLPVMTMVFNAIGLIGAYVYAVMIAGVDAGSFIEHFRYLTDPSDYLQGGIKAAIFGASLSLAACYQGYNVRGGAKEVGLATTRAVVAGSVSVLVIDFFVGDALGAVFPFQS